MRKSKVLQKLANDEIAIMTSVSLTANWKLVEVAGMIGFDCLWIDTEHRDFSTDDVGVLALAGRAADIDTCVRIRKQDYGDFFRPLELRATAIMVPHVMSAKEARWAVRNAKFHPQGLRGMDGGGPDGDYLMADMLTYIKEANRETFIVAQIEDREAVEQVEEIAAVPGIDILLVGPGDLSQSYGVPFNPDHKEVQAAIERIAGAARDNGKHWAIPVATLEAFRRYAEMGARLINFGADLLWLTQAMRQAYTELKAICDEVQGR